MVTHDVTPCVSISNREILQIKSVEIRVL